MDQNLDYYIFGKGGTLIPLNHSNYDDNGLNAVNDFLSSQSNPKDQFITYNKTNAEIKNISKEEYEKVESKFNDEKNLQVLKKESFTLIEYLLSLIMRLYIWKDDIKFKVENDFNGRHETESLFYKRIKFRKSQIGNSRNNWFEGKWSSTGAKILNNFIVDFVAEENKKKEKNV